MRLSTLELECYELAANKKMSFSDAKYLIEKSVKAFTIDQIEKVKEEFKQIMKIPEGETYGF